MMPPLEMTLDALFNALSSFQNNKSAFILMGLFSIYYETKNFAQDIF